MYFKNFRVEVYKNLDLEDILGDAGSETRNPWIKASTPEPWYYH